MVKFLTYFMPQNSKSFAFGDTNKNDFYCISSNGSVMPNVVIKTINSKVKCFKRNQINTFNINDPYNRFQNDIFNTIENSVDEIK